MPKTNLKALSKEELEAFVSTSGLPAFRANQLLHWIYDRRVSSVHDITEFSKGLRETLEEQTYISNLTLLEQRVSNDGTEKFLFGLEDGESIESVLIPDNHRLSLCISSQVGCAMRCTFCLTGKLCLKRQLRAFEIVDQIISVSRIIARSSRRRHPSHPGGEGTDLRITNIVLMGMGEPLANFDEVVDALWRITEYLRIPKRRITLSTAGIVPGIRKLPERAPRINLAISLNASTDAVRDRIMPVNLTYPITALLDACRKFPLQPGRRITFEYVLLKHVNDSLEDAKRLALLLRGISAKVNLIPFNPYDGSGFQRPDDEKVVAFQEVLTSKNLAAFVRKSKGRDILAACGQLKAGYH
ncbi:MAG TPA: 23S rRNA (adenine(2503)-C(2))-methyltransferase RlmN [Thermodesulfovibrionales bacterium]|nr:23S rRNA (adenine(2503)-C(2))-methyltransferase RlmN [Thermodesulfovibrionales bacterium]